jgi:hypothetical protein
MSQARLARLLACVLIAASLPLPIAAIAGDDTYSGRAVQEAGKASTLGSAAASHASGAAANALISTGQVTSGVAAVPLSVGGAAVTSAGAAMMSGAAALGKAASAKPGAPLPITDESLTAMPPNEALKRDKTPPMKN